MNTERSISNPQVRLNDLLKNVYLWMTAGLLLTAVVAYFVGTNENLLRMVYSTGGSIILVIAQLAVVLILTARIGSMSSTSAVIWFAVYSTLTGATLSIIIASYTGAVVSQAFFTTALMFGGMSIFGMTTKQDLSRWSSVLVMALWGLVVASLINMIFRSTGLYYIMSYIGVVVFCGVTAWDTQKIKNINEEYGYGIDEETYVKISIIGALQLYLDFINIFLYLLRIFGNSRRK